MERAKQLASEHGKYIRELLNKHGEDPWTIEKIMWHYETAMVHGYKHGLQDSGGSVFMLDGGSK